MRLARFRPRILAFMVDYVALNLLARAGGIAGQTIAGMMTQAHAASQPQMVPATEIGLIFGAAFWLSAGLILNYGVLQGLHGATLGKWLMGLKVVGRRGANITIGQSFLRFASYLVSYLPAFLGFFAFFWSKRRQTWHDSLCGTMVIVAPKKEAKIKLHSTATVLYLPAPEDRTRKVG